MQGLRSLYKQFRKKTFPPSVNDIEWRFQTLMREIELSERRLERVIECNALGSTGNFVIHNFGPWRLLLDRVSLVDRTILTDGVWEPEQMNYLFSGLRYFGAFPDKNVFLDVGSYFGLYSLKAVEAAAFSEIHAFEADRHTIGQLYGNIFLNGLSRKIAIHNLAASDHKGEVVFRDSRAIAENRGASGVVREGTSESYKTPCDSLDNLFSFKKNILMKLDVEGHEAQVLNGMKNLLTNPSYSRSRRGLLSFATV